MISVQIITTYNDFLNLKNSWDSLLLKSGIQNPYLTHDWFRITYEHFEKENDLFILVAQREGEVLGIAPCILSKGKYFGLRIKKIRFLVNVHTPQQDFITTNEYRTEAIAAIFDFLQTNTRRWDVFELKEIRENSAALFLLEENCNRRNIFHSRFPISTSWSVPTNISFESALAKISGQIKRKFRKYLRRLENFGHLTFRIITDYDEIEEHLQLFFDFYERSWKGREKNSDFYYNVARTFCQTHNAFLFALCLDQKPIAYVFSLKSGRILFGRKATFDSAYSAFSPGTALIYKIFEYSLLTEDIDAYDFGRGNEQYKLNLGSVSVNQISILGAHKKTVVSYLFFLRYKIVLFLKNNKYSSAILNSFRNNFIFNREIFSKVKTKYSKSRKNRKHLFYFRPIQAAEVEKADTGLKGKYAVAEDLNHLAVATKAKRLTDLIERLEKEKCFLITRDDKIEHYFWLSKTYNEFEPATLKDKSLVVTEYDTAFTQLDKKMALKICNMLCSDLVFSKCNNLIIAVNPNDSKGRDLVESLGFKKYDPIN